jgi:hypothetical protein
MRLLRYVISLRAVRAITKHREVSALSVSDLPSFQQVIASSQ